MKKKAVILLSGGLDSSTCVAIAKSQGYELYAMSFDYGQRSVIELNSAKKIARQFRVKEHKIVTLDFLKQIKGSALTDNSEDVARYDESRQNIPNTYVPARNTLFITMALSWAEVLGASAIFIGASAVDYSGYPDCRPEYFIAMQNLINYATKRTVSQGKIIIKTPLIDLSKAATIKLGLSLGVNYADTVSCYQLNDKSEACGVCESCGLRKKAFINADVVDPTKYLVV